MLLHLTWDISALLGLKLFIFLFSLWYFYRTENIFLVLSINDRNCTKRILSLRERLTKWIHEKLWNVCNASSVIFYFTLFSCTYMMNLIMDNHNHYTWQQSNNHPDIILSRSLYVRVNFKRNAYWKAGKWPSQTGFIILYIRP